MSEQSYQSALGEFYEGLRKMNHIRATDIDYIITEWEEFRLTKANSSEIIALKAIGSNRIEFADQEAIGFCPFCYDRLPKTDTDKTYCRICGKNFYSTILIDHWDYLEQLSWRLEEEIYHSPTKPRSETESITELKKISKSEWYR